ncbi:MAG TPA: phage portal protein, partial [Promineifilum sp.]
RSQSLFISGYEYAVPGQSPVTMRAEDVIDFKLFDPLNLYRGYPPAAVAGRVGDVDNATTDYLKLFMEKGGMPPGLLKTKQKLIDTDVNDIRRRWSERYGGFSHWLEPAVLDSDAEYQKVGLTFEEMGFDVLDARSEARICMVIGVPPILVGAKIGLDRATYSNYGEARLAWWEDTLIPQYRNFENVIANDLAPEFGEGLTVEFDFDDVPALKESEDAKWGRAGAALAGGYITVNEAREHVGLDTIGQPGEVFLRPSSASETDMSGERVHAPVIEPVVQPDEDEDEDETEAAALLAYRSTLELDYKAGRRPPDDNQRREFERRLRRGLNEYFEGQLGRIEDELGERYMPATVKNGSNGTANV